MQAGFVTNQRTQESFYNTDSRWSTFFLMYELEGLQQLAIEKRRMVTPMTFKPFLSVSDHIYNNCNFDGPFWPDCRQQISYHTLQT